MMNPVRTLLSIDVPRTFETAVSTSRVTLVDNRWGF